MRALTPAVLATLLLCGSVRAEDAACARFKWPVDREVQAFKDDGLPMVASGSALPGLMAPVRLTLVPQAGVVYPVAPVHKPKHAPAFGGFFTLPPTASANTYQVTLSDEAWIDVAQDGKLLKQVGFTGTQDCKAVRKSVRFAVGTGPLTIEISDAAAESLKIDVLPKER